MSNQIGCVYFIGSPCGGFIKIGYSDDNVPQSRYKSHRKKGDANGAIHVQLTTALCHVAGIFKEEQSIHRYFDHLRVPELKETFRADPELLRYIVWLRSQWHARRDQAGTDVPDVERFEKWGPTPDRCSHEYFIDRDLLSDDVWGLPTPTKRPAKEGWIPPAQYIEVATKTFGVIDLDPDSFAARNREIAATNYYDCGLRCLQMPWYGKVWMYPTSNHEQMLDHAVLQLDSNVKELIVLLDVDKFNAQYMYRIMRRVDRMCVIWAKVEWPGRPENKKDGVSPRHGYFLLYFGANAELFDRHASVIGTVWKPS